MSSTITTTTTMTPGGSSIVGFGDCPKFLPNIFNKTKCSQCFRIREEHGLGGNGINNGNDKIPNRTIVKCGHLFIAPTDFTPERNKRWQRRWFILYEDGELTYSIDEHPEAIPQGTIEMNAVHQVSSAESITSHQYSISLETNSMDADCVDGDGDLLPCTVTYYLKAGSGEEYRSWMRVLTKYGQLTNQYWKGRDRRESTCSNMSSISQVSQVSTNIGETGSQGLKSPTTPTEIEIHGHQQPPPSVVVPAPVTVPVNVNYYHHNHSHHHTSSTTGPPTMPINTPVNLPSRGDPDGCGSVESSRKGWLQLLDSQEKKWKKFYFTLITNKLVCYTSPEDNVPLQSYTLENSSLITKEDGPISTSSDGQGNYPFTITFSPGKSRLILSTLTNSNRTGWISSLTNAIPTDYKTKLLQFKNNFTSTKSELETLSMTCTKLNSIKLDSLKTKLSSGFIQLDKLEYELNTNLDELKRNNEKLENELSKLRSDVSTLGLLRDENELLTERLNDLTEKYYTSEKNLKVLKQRLSRYKSNSLKEKQLEMDIYTKIKDLEGKLSLGSGTSSPLPQESTSPTDGILSPPPTPANNSKNLINIIMRLNEIDNTITTTAKQQNSLQQQQQPPAEWYKCTNCDVLQSEINGRDEKLNELEECVGELEKKLGNIEDTRKKYKNDLEEIKTLCRDSVLVLESSYKRMVAELEEKHDRDMQDLEIEKETALAEETKATMAAIEALRKNHELEVKREIIKFREEFLAKYRGSGNIDLLHQQHEEEINELKSQLLQLSEKYTNKCMEVCDLEMKLDQMESELTQSLRAKSRNSQVSSR